MTIEFTTIILKTFEVDLPNNKNKKKMFKIIPIFQLKQQKKNEQ
jgi:hypothetical protein